MSKRSFSRAEPQQKARDYHGSAHFGRISPDVRKQGVKSLNIEVPFEEALKLSLALNSCVQAINRYNRSTKEGRAMGVVLAIKMDNSFISVIEMAMRAEAAEAEAEAD